MVGDIQILLKKTTLSQQEATTFVEDESCGAISLFLGNVRNNNRQRGVTHLFFESYEPMALKEMRAIAEKQKKQAPIHKIYFAHRLGEINLKEAAVIIAVSAKHRKAAIESCSEIINELKETVPIWKKEFYEDGSYWINSRP